MRRCSIASWCAWTRSRQAGWRDQKGPIIDAALVVLADGHPRTGDDVWAEARNAGSCRTRKKKTSTSRSSVTSTAIAVRAQYATLIGPDFAQDVALRDELLNHNVSCWTTADLTQCLEGAYDPVELEALFAPGFVRQHIDDIAWERAHGFAKRVAVVCDVLRANAARVQTVTVAHPADAPRLDENAALLMVDAALTALDAHRPCTLADVRAAFRHLTDPLVGEAIYTDEAQTAIVFRRLPQG